MTQLLQRHGFMYDQLPVILWALLIFVASSIPNIALPNIEFIASDKVIHLVVYFVLCVLFHRALSHQKRFPGLARWSLACAVLFSILYGVSDEIHQSFVPNRDASLYDLAADSIGTLLFLSYSVLRHRYRSKTA
jgi:VanZ family protein